MPKMVDAVAAVDALNERVTPALERFEDNVRKGRRMVVRAQHAVEDQLGATVRRVRRHPLRTVALAAGVGVLAGSLIGFALGRLIPK